MTNDLMLDLETMGSGPKAAIVSVGAVRFNLATGETGAYMHEQVDLEDSVRAGLEIDPATVIWWFGQSRAAVDGWRVEHPKQLASALNVLDHLVGREATTGVWANAPSFDCVILKSAYGLLGRQPPWQFWRERCVRTILQLSRDTGLDVKATTKRTGEAHDALADCHTQIEQVCRAWAHIRGG